MALDCVAVSLNVSNLQARLRVLQRELENCTNNCDAIERQIETVSEELATAEQQQATCELLQSFLGAWAFNGNGFTGIVTLDSGYVLDIGIMELMGIGVIDGPPGNPISGYYDHGTLRFSREIFVGGTEDNSNYIHQLYTGYQFAMPRGRTAITFAGTFTSSESPNVTFGWFMSKQ